MNGIKDLWYILKQKNYLMIISFKYKFIFIKTYKTAGSSIESYLYQFLDTNDVYAHTADNNGINCWGNLIQKINYQIFLINIPIIRGSVKN